MSGTARSGRRRYAYPVAIGDDIRYRIESEPLYHRLRNALYHRADSSGHSLKIQRRDSTLIVRRVA